jgi:hypothetical protein
LQSAMGIWLSIRYLGGQVSVRVPLSAVTDFVFLSRALICLGEVCVRQVVVDSVTVIKMENVLGDVSFKIIKIFLLFANTGTNSANLVSSARWRELRGLSLRSLHILWSVWHTFLPPAAELRATVQSYPVPLGAVS